MYWVFLSLVGAFGQALGSAVKKKALQTPGMNNVIGFLSFTFAGVIFWALYTTNSDSFWMYELSPRFWQAMIWYAGLNILAVWFMYKALDVAEFNHLMPFMALTSLSLVVPPMLLLGEAPSSTGLIGIVFIVSGVFLMHYQQKEKKETGNDSAEEKRRANRKGMQYFLVTAICFTITPTVQKITVQESSVFFASAVVHVLIGLGFFTILLWSKELPKLYSVLSENRRRGFFLSVLLAGAIIILENGSINAALTTAPVAYVFALKRLMPLFAFLIGVLYFREREKLLKKFAATALMIVGAVTMTLA